MCMRWGCVGNQGCAGLQGRDLTSEALPACSWGATCTCSSASRPPTHLDVLSLPPRPAGALQATEEIPVDGRNAGNGTCTFLYSPYADDTPSAGITPTSASAPARGAAPGRRLTVKVIPVGSRMLVTLQLVRTANGVAGPLEVLQLDVDRYTAGGAGAAGGGATDKGSGLREVPDLVHRLQGALDKAAWAGGGAGVSAAAAVGAAEVRARGNAGWQREGHQGGGGRHAAITRWSGACQGCGSRGNAQSRGCVCARHVFMSLAPEGARHARAAVRKGSRDPLPALVQGGVACVCMLLLDLRPSHDTVLDQSRCRCPLLL